MSPKPATITLGLVSPSLIGLGSLLPRRNLSTNASSSAKSPSRRTEAFSARMNGANELCIGVGIRPEMLGEWSFWNGPGERWIESEKTLTQAPSLNHRI